MHIKLAYGKNGLPIELSDDLDVTIVEPHYIAGLADPHEAILRTLRAPIAGKPLKDMIKPGDKVGIVFSDITRPTPNQIIMPAILAELADIPSENITLFNALGTHRPNTPQELRDMLGDTVVDSYRIVQNNAFDTSTQVNLGVSSRGHEIWLNREFVACDVKVLTGFIEPHFFAGFSGGGKAVIPGMAGEITVLGNHDAGNIGNPKSTWGISRGNPIWEEINEVANKLDNVFLVNVTLNRDKQVTNVFAGALDESHAEGCQFVKQNAMVAVEQPFDIVITTNSGYPLDLNLYQTVKGMSAAAQVVREGGTIIIASECWDGIPAHGLYGTLLANAESPQALLEEICRPGFLEQDQWQAQVQVLVQLKADVYVYSENLTDEQIKTSLLQPCRNIETTVQQLLEKYGARAKICVLPEGPQTIPYLP